MLSVTQDAQQHRPRANIFGVDIDVTTSASAVERILSWCHLGWRQLVVTPNLDHVVALRSNPALVAAYERADLILADGMRSEEHTSELQSLMRISYAVFCLKKKIKNTRTIAPTKHRGIQ